MVDTVRYQLPFGKPGQWLARAFVRKDIQKIFDYREEQITSYFRENSAINST